VQFSIDTDPSGHKPRPAQSARGPTDPVGPAPPAPDPARPAAPEQLEAEPAWASRAAAELFAAVNAWLTAELTHHDLRAWTKVFRALEAAEWEENFRWELGPAAELTAETAEGGAL
jgi:hypothetical protein